MDVYLQPHSDDVCFSLGGLADRRRAGAVLTVCPVTGYVPLRPGDVAPPAQAVTALRMAEDEAFCRACGLVARALDLPCSSFLGHRPFDLSRVDENRKRIEAPLLAAVLALAGEEDSGTRSWLFCPCGVGDHVDHVAVFDAVMGNYRRLSARFRIAFYEDLHYASKPKARRRGIRRMLASSRGRPLRRQYLPLGPEAAARKLALINLYASQFLAAPTELAAYSPAARPRDAAYEAIWSEDPYPDAIPVGDAATFFAALSRPWRPLRGLVGTAVDGDYGDGRQR